MDRKDFEVIVVGAGSAGLALAQGLKKAGISYTLCERDSQKTYFSKPRDWGMLLHWGRPYLEQSLPTHLRNRLREAQVDPSYAGMEPPVHCNLKTGEILPRAPVPAGLARVSRRKLRMLLSEDLDIEFGKSVMSATTNDSQVTVHFEDGSGKTGNLLVGCDGSRSRIREMLVGVDASKPSDHGFSMINFPASYTAEQARHLRSLHPIVTVANHPEVSASYLLAILDVPDADRPETWKFQNYSGWHGPPYAKDLREPAERMRVFKSRALHYCEPFRTAALSVDDDVVLPVDPGSSWAPIQWDNRDGMITLAGDAAHPMMPHRGQGLNNGMQDASLIVDAVKAVVYENANPKEAIDGYEREMRPRAIKEVHLSLEQAQASTKNDWDQFLNSPRFKIGLNKPA